MVKKKTYVTGVVLLAVAVFFAWRFTRFFNIFEVGAHFERPVPTDIIPAPLTTLRAQECGACHSEIYQEWATTIHSQAWTDPYFQVDWVFDGSQQICKNCHIPLDRQQEFKVLGFRDKDKWDPILAPNPDFDPELQQEGITCAVCHLREGVILGPAGSQDAPHPVRKLQNSNEICVNCHVVEDNRWDSFYSIPPCGTVAEISATSGAHNDGENGRSPSSVAVKLDAADAADDGRGSTDGELHVLDVASLKCVECHMPLVEVNNGTVRPVRRHLWRGGHDPAMVKSALKTEVLLPPGKKAQQRNLTVTVTNVGAAHYFPTGTPDRHLTVELYLLDEHGKTIKEQRHKLIRTIIWRPFIIDWSDTRLRRGEPRSYSLDFSLEKQPRPQFAEVVVRYHLLEEKRRQRIGYQNKEPIAYDIYRQRIALEP